MIGKCVKQLMIHLGLFINKPASLENIRRALSYFHVSRIDKALVRVGNGDDGGYLLPNDFLGISACFSPGVGESSIFEQELWEKWGIPSYLADYSVEGPAVECEGFYFEKKFIGLGDEKKFIKFDEWIHSNVDVNKCGDFILQMDIEGGEYENLISISDKVFNKIRILVIEFHNVPSLIDRDFNKTFLGVLERINTYFYPVHIHPNNCCGSFTYKGVVLPENIEVVYIRKDRVITNGYMPIELFPNKLDTKNVKNLDDILLSKEWFGNAE